MNSSYRILVIQKIIYSTLIIVILLYLPAEKNCYASLAEPIYLNRLIVIFHPSYEESTIKAVYDIKPSTPDNPKNKYNLFVKKQLQLSPNGRNEQTLTGFTSSYLTNKEKGGKIVYITTFLYNLDKDYIEGRDFTIISDHFNFTKIPSESRTAYYQEHVHLVMKEKAPDGMTEPVYYAFPKTAGIEKHICVQQPLPEPLNNELLFNNNQGNICSTIHLSHVPTQPDHALDGYINQCAVQFIGGDWANPESCRFKVAFHVQQDMNGLTSSGELALCILPEGKANTSEPASDNRGFRCKLSPKELDVGHHIIEIQQGEQGRDTETCDITGYKQFYEHQQTSQHYRLYLRQTVWGFFQSSYRVTPCSEMLTLSKLRQNTLPEADTIPVPTLGFTYPTKDQEKVEYLTQANQRLQLEIETRSASTVKNEEPAVTEKLTPPTPLKRITITKQPSHCDYHCVSLMTAHPGEPDKTYAKRVANAEAKQFLEPIKPQDKKLTSPEKWVCLVCNSKEIDRIKLADHMMFHSEEQLKSLRDKHCPSCQKQFKAITRSTKIPSHIKTCIAHQ